MSESCMYAAVVGFCMFAMFSFPHVAVGAAYLMNITLDMTPLLDAGFLETVIDAFHAWKRDLPQATPEYAILCVECFVYTLVQRSMRELQRVDAAAPPGVVAFKPYAWTELAADSVVRTFCKPLTAALSWPQLDDHALVQ